MQLNKDQLYASMPDNTTGQILPLTMRNFVDSVELKYDNWTVVKPGNIAGNKFPDPDINGHIVLPSNTVWVINGAVTVLYPIYYEDNVTITGMSGSYLTDTLGLDASAGALALINSSASNTILNMRNLGISMVGTSGRVFEIDDPTICVFSMIAFQCSALGTINFTGGEGDCYFVDRCICIVTGTALQLTGTGGNLIFDGTRSGVFHAAEMFDLQGTFNGVFISDCYSESSFSMFRILDDSVAEKGIITGCVANSAAAFINGIDETSVTFTFANNVGMRNTIVGGSLVMARNATTTPLSSSAFVDINGNSQDVLVDLACRFERSAPLVLKYLGAETINAQAVASVNISTGGVLAGNFNFAFFKNGEIVAQTYDVTPTSITHVTTTASVTLPAAADSLYNGAIVVISGADQPEYNGSFVISNLGGGNTTFDYTMASDPGADATGTLVAGIPVSPIFQARLESASSVITLSMCCDMLLETDDEIKIMVMDDSGAASTITVGYLTFSIRQ